MPTNPGITAAPGSLWQVVMRGHYGGVLTENVLNFRAETNVDDWELRIIFALISCYMQLLSGQPTDMVYDDVLWKQTAPVLGVEHVTPFGDPNVGTVAGDSLPTFCSVVCSIRTALGGRSHRGRIYLPGIPESSTTINTINTGSPTWAQVFAFAACLASKFINLGDPPPVNSARIGVYSRKLGGAAFPFGTQGFTPAVSITPNQLIATTRSRKQGHGP